MLHLLPKYLFAMIKDRIVKQSHAFKSDAIFGSFEHAWSDEGEMRRPILRSVDSNIAQVDEQDKE